MAKKLFVTGTGTDVGKTYVTGLILKKLVESGVSVGYFKPAMSGNEKDKRGRVVPGDALAVKKISGIGQPTEEMCPYVYEKAVSPHLAARMEGNPARKNTMLAGLAKVCARYEYVVAEGAGGILCPLALDEEELWLADIVREGGFSCLLVADAGLGTINQVGLTAFYLKEQKIPLKGIVFNRYDPADAMHRDNRMVCERLTGVKVVACVRENDTDLAISARDWKALYE